MNNTRIISSRIKKLHVPLTDRIVTTTYHQSEDDLISSILKMPEDLEVYDAVFQKKLSELQERYHLEQFKGWCMPEPRSGYIKASKHNLL
jgi:hypothetical protein